MWDATQHFIRMLDHNGETGAAQLLVQLGNLGEEAIAYNSLVISWSKIARLALEKSAAPAQPVQDSLEF